MCEQDYRISIFRGLQQTIMKKLVKNKTDLISFLIPLAIFSYFFLCCDMKECEDSFQYLHQYPMREPVYSLLLQFLLILRGDSYGFLLSFIQNTLAFVCVCWTCKRIVKLFSLSDFFQYVIILILVSPYVVTPLASKSHLVITTTVMTEGIAIALYYVWFTILLGILTDYYTGKQLITSYICSFSLALLLVLTRGQMALCLLLWMLVCCFKAIQNKKYKFVFLFIFIALFAFPMKSQLTKWYNYAETGFYVDTISSKPMLMANIIYVADESDGQYISDEDLRNAFVTILSKAKADGMTIDSAVGNIIEKALYHEYCHEPLNFDYIDPAIREVILARNGINEERFLELMIEEDTLCGQMATQLLPHIFTKFLKNYFVIISLGFVRTVAVEKSFLPLYALMLYIFAIALSIYSLVKKGLNKAVLAMVLILLSICGTVMGTALMIECLTRYMIYNLPFMYIIGLNLVKTVFRTKD